MKRDQTAELMQKGAGASLSLAPADRRRDSRARPRAGDAGVDTFLQDSTIMMVDDATTTLKVLQAFLEDAGYRHFLPLSEPEKAFGVLVDEVPDLVLLDINMPGVSGFDILSFMRARETFQHTPVIVLTSSTDAETRLRALQLGATEFLSKPVEESELVLRLRNTLTAKRYLDQQTYFDRTTGLANRRLFLERLAREVKHAERDSRQCAVMLINVDRFKKINDNLGHTIGDDLLKALGDRLAGLVRSDDVVCRPDSRSSNGLLARIGGDEFTVLLTDLQDVTDVAGVAERMLAELSRSFEIGGRELFITASIGSTVYPQDGTDGDLLLMHGNLAMSRAKRRGRNCYQAYDSGLEKTNIDTLKLESELHRALERSEFVLQYQPKVDVRTGYVVGAETLVRWEHPERGMVPPGEFIALAEDAGLIGDIGNWVLAEACRQNAAWHSSALKGLQLAVNVSGHQFRDRDFVGEVRRVLQASGLAPHCLTLELTEGVMIEDAKENIDVLHALKDIGVKLSVDDFGTGYSSLSYLEQFPLDELKIDRSFVSKIDTLTGEAPIVSAIIAMAHSLRFSLVAEGVETEQQLDFLRRHKCEYYQGYLFSKPLVADEFRELAANWRLESM